MTKNFLLMGMLVSRLLVSTPLLTSVKGVVFPSKILIH
jgi:hypothetical protein